VPAEPNEERRWQVKPLEARELFTASNNNSQGTVQCWVDILRPEEAKQFPPDDVALPPKQMFEVRVVIWKAKNVVAMDGLEQMSDLFVKCWPESCDVQTTDTHWRAKKGKASWNWRLLFDVELGHNTRAMKFPYLHLQMWDKDILKYNDCVGETTFNLGMYFQKAYKKNVALKLFEKPKGAAASKLRRAQNKKKGGKERIEIPDDGMDIPPESDTMERSALIAAKKENFERNQSVLTGDSDDEFDTSPVSFSIAKGAKGIEMTENPMSGVSLDSDDEVDSTHSDDEELQNNLNPATNTLRAADAIKREKAAVAEKKDTKEAASGGWFGWGGGGGDKPEDEEELLGSDSEDEENEEDEDVKETATSIKNMTGLWDIDPEDSSWAKIYSHDHNSGETALMGELCYSVQIWPKDKAAVMRVGAARSEPNTDPRLPPPVGRMKFYLNPFLMGAELCGPALCAKLFCCLLCIALCLLMIFCQPFLTLLINLAFMF